MWVVSVSVGFLGTVLGARDISNFRGRTNGLFLSCLTPYISSVSVSSVNGYCTCVKGRYGKSGSVGFLLSTRVSRVNFRIVCVSRRKCVCVHGGNNVSICYVPKSRIMVQASSKRRLFNVVNGGPVRLVTPRREGGSVRLRAL